MVQKWNQSITLHHATLTMNFATLSCISSLAVAPTLSIWRLTPREYYAKRLVHDFLDDDEDYQHRMVGTAVDAIAGRNKRKIERARNRQRLFLALALLTQVFLQWAWGVVLFVSPVYSQTNCSGDTALIFFLARFAARDINDNYMVVWVLWLLFSLGITMGMTIVLALTSPARARSSARSTPASTIGTTGTRTTTTSSSTISRPVLEQLFVSAVAAVPSWRDKPGQRIFWYNVLCTVLWLVYIISSEIQIQANCIFVGENIISSFGQITALLLSLAPLWSLTVAVYKWPQMQRKLERRRRREARTTIQSFESPLAPTGANGADDSDADDGKPGVPKGAETTDVVINIAAPANDYAAPAPVHAHASAHHRLHHARAARARAAASAHTRVNTLDDVYLPRSTTEEWNQLATFPRSVL